MSHIKTNGSDDTKYHRDKRPAGQNPTKWVAAVVKNNTDSKHERNHDHAAGNAKASKARKLVQACAKAEIG